MKIVTKETYKDYTFYVVEFDNHFCGYVTIPKDHFFYERDYEYFYHYFKVYGGISYCGVFEDDFCYGFACDNYGDTKATCGHDFVVSQSKGLCDQIDAFGQSKDAQELVSRIIVAHEGIETLEEEIGNLTESLSKVRESV